MTDWHNSLDDRSHDLEKAKRLANVLAGFDGEREKKIKFLVANMPRMESNAALRLQQQGLNPEDSTQMGRAMVSLAIAYWKEHLLRLKREKPQEEGSREGTLTRLDCIRERLEERK